MTNFLEGSIERRGRIALAVAFAWVLGGGIAARPALGSPSGVRVLSPEQVLADCTVRARNGDLLFTDDEGDQFRLLTSTSDPEIANRGDGSFHPADEASVAEVLRNIPAGFTAALSVTIYLLPYPRSGQLSSSASGNCIAISPGVLPYSASQVEMLAAHELGHMVQYALLPDQDAAGWAAYARLRGIDDPARFNDAAVHANRPHEIFAEDFRVLFGGATARGDGSIENRTIRPPDQVPGLREFFLNLIPSRLAAGQAANTATLAWSVYPNPMRPGQVFTLTAPASSTPLTVRLLDVTGREVVRLGAGTGSSGQWSLTLPRSVAGRALAPGAYWLHVEGARASGTGVALPVRVVAG